MNWTETLRAEIDSTYRATEGLVKLVDKDKLGWKPATGSNWMNTGQLLEHLTSACGACCKGFTTGDWGMPSGDDAKPDDMLPSAAKMPSAKSVDETLKKLAADKKVALDMLAKAGEKDLASRKVSAPWDPTEKPLGHQFLMSVQHLNQHKGQLFYYLKLQGKPVDTGTLWGM
jgi:DinB family protein